MLETVTSAVLYAVTFPVDDRNSSKPVYFSTEREANRCARLPRGYFGSRGSVYRELFDMKPPHPKYYETVESWAKDNLTYNEFQKMFG